MRVQIAEGTSILMGVRLIFLDFDGVLSNFRSLADSTTLNQKWGLRVAEECLLPLEWLIQQSGAQIVLSSTLRDENHEKWSACLQDLGVPSANVIGATPRLLGVERGYEIDAWLKKYRQRGGNVESFVILDDDNDMVVHAARLVQTDYASGLTMKNARRALRVLERPYQTD